MIRILHIVYVMNRAGLETFIMNVYRNIDRSKIQFDFLVHTDEKGHFDDEIYSLGGKIFYAVPRNKGIIANRKSLDNFFRTHSDYKIVHLHASSLSYLEPLVYAKKYKVPVRILHSHNTKEGGSGINKYLHIYHKMFLKNIVTNYFACSSLAALWMFGVKIVNKKKCNIIKNAINTDIFAFNSDIRNSVRNKLSLEDKIVIGHIGRFNIQKNHSFLIDIFKEICKKNNNFILLLVGDGELRGEIEKKIEQLNLKNNVILTGVRSDIPDLLQAMDVFLFPSLYEGLPVTLVEAQASGLHCIISDKITKEVKIKNLIEYVSLDEPASYWSDKVLKSNYYGRKDMREEVKKAGYDIKGTAKWLEDFYIRASDG